MSQRSHPFWVVGVGLLMGAFALPSWAADEATKFFETKVRPLLVQNCFECHSDKKQKGGLRLDSREAVLKGGKNGHVITPGHPEQSKLLLAVSYRDADLQMPPENQLSAEQVHILTQWVKLGAPWGAAATSPAAKSKKRVITDQDRAFWSFQPVKDHATPAVKDTTWPRGEVDKFILAKLEAEGFSPAGMADKRTLARRAYFDLHGLPPTPQEIEAFVNDHSADAWEKLIDKLLESPRYGERWGRHWLDVVRYAESDGYKQDSYRPNAWPYRDYVIRSFNQDKPYDRFVAEQLAGDEIAPHDPKVMVATGYLRHGIYEYNQADARQQWAAILDEVTDVTADVVLGLSMGCAKCHDHKFDPILQSDYYNFQAFFTPLLHRNDLPLATPQERAQYESALAKWEEKTASIRARIAELEKSAFNNARKGAIEKFPLDIRALIDKPQKQRTPYEEQLVQLAYRQVIEKTANLTPKLSDKLKQEYDDLRKKLAEFEKDKPKTLMEALVATDVGPVAPPTTVLNDPEHRTFQPAYPVVLEGQPLTVPQILPTQDGTGRRLALAKWLTQPNHPLTARVMVNRIWQHHFGRGLVGTSSDYGTLGDRPSHPELLDYLAKRFVEGGWSIKAMHRLIMNSAAYQQSSTRPIPEVAKAKDPENRLLWKHSGRRLDAEQIRDAMLLASGELRLNDMFGPAVDAVQPRRSVYTKMWRNARDPLLDAFDLPDTFSSAAERNRTTTAMQALLMINGDWPLKRAEMMASRLRSMGFKNNDDLIEGAWTLAYGRTPTTAERGAAATFLERHPAAKTSVASTIDAKPVLKTMPQLGSQAIYVRDARIDDMLRLSSPTGMPAEDFTVEAYVLLESLHNDASVRVIASQWDGKQTSPGWSFGVTSTQSKYNPRNLILQLCCDPSKPGGGYEVIASDFKLELHKTYYVAVSVRMSDPAEAGITFHLKDISDMDAPLQSTTLNHKVTGAYAPSKAALVIGGRDSNPPHGWDGLIDEVRVTKKALGKEELLYNDGSPSRQSVVGHWRFEDQPGIFKDAAEVQPDLIKRSPKAETATNPDAALIDLCHVLLNSNEFLYLE